MKGPDAVVVGAGPNGLVAANILVDAGWEVLVLEAQPTPGGAVRTAELTLPGFHHDLFSAFYPLAAASPAMRSLELERHGLRWARAPLVLAHPFLDGRCAVLSMNLDETAASLDAFSPGDGDAWRRLYERWGKVGAAAIDALFRPFPPVLPAIRVAAAVGPRDLLSFARFALLSARRLGTEEFGGEGARLLLAGNTLHTDLSPEQALGGAYGWLLCSLGQQLGFPVPQGGAGEITAALVRRLEAKGGQVVCNARVSRIEVRRGRAVGVRTADGREVGPTRAVLADVLAPALYLDLVGREHLSPRFLEALRRFDLDNATVKVDWALSGSIPWTCPLASQAGTVHVGESLDHLSQFSFDLATGLIPAQPFLLAGQMTTADPTRSPAGTETAWAYTHVPQQVKGDAGGSLRGLWDETETEVFADRMEAQVERFAPGFRDRILARHVFTPLSMQRADANLVGGAVNAGTSAIHQQLVFRPTPRWGRPETPIAGLYLASASAHPGGGVHGAPGANAARVALLHARARRVLPAAAVGAGALGATSGLAKRQCSSSPDR